ncbi:MAG: hypothetical protein JRJ54_15325 [Deltaproteobacteria bacterium]|nr:hypothetical protein [Deltaproteobacteria bacterium]
MLLVKLTIDSTTHRLSIDGAAFEHFWEPFLMRFSPVKRMLSSEYGGYAALEFGDFAVSPEFFGSDYANTWPPPVSVEIEALYTASNEAAAETVLKGTAHLRRISRREVVYGFHAPAYDETIADSTAYNDTLNNVMTSILTSIAEISSVDTSKARATSPNVKFTVSGEQLAVELADAVAKSFTHLFYIDGSTAHLVDMKGDNGSRTITGFDFFPVEYEYAEPISVIRSGDYSRQGDYPYGQEMTVDIKHDTQANIEAALDDILTVLNMPRCRLPVPFLGSLPVPGEKISWTDTALFRETAAWIRARTLTFDFEAERVVIEGEGGISAA